MTPLLIAILITWAIFIITGIALAQAKRRGAPLGAIIGFAAGLAGILLGIIGLVVGAGALILLAVLPAAEEPSRY
jgi:hypothetical protein